MLTYDFRTHHNWQSIHWTIDVVLEISLKDCDRIVRIIITHLLIINHNGTYCSFITYLVHKLIICQISYKFVMVKSIRNHFYHNSNWRVKIAIFTINNSHWKTSHCETIVIIPFQLNHIKEINRVIRLLFFIKFYLNNILI